MLQTRDRHGPEQTAEVLSNLRQFLFFFSLIFILSTAHLLPCREKGSETLNSLIGDRSLSSPLTHHRRKSDVALGAVRSENKKDGIQTCRVHRSLADGGPS